MFFGKTATVFALGLTLFSHFSFAAASEKVGVCYTAQFGKCEMPAGSYIESGACYCPIQDGSIKGVYFEVDLREYQSAESVVVCKKQNDKVLCEGVTYTREER